MIITSLLAVFVTLMLRGRVRLGLIGALALFGLLEFLFLGSNLTKIAAGGWLPLVVGAGIFLLLTTWKRGSELVAGHRRGIDIPMTDFLRGMLPDVPRVPGTAVYLTSDPDLVPSALWPKSSELIVDETLRFIRACGNKPFYVNLWSIIPHAALNPTEEPMKPAAALADALDLARPAVEAALLRLEHEGFAMRGTFSAPDARLEWCERRLLARIHRYTVKRLRAEIEPVSAADLHALSHSLAACRTGVAHVGA